MSDTAAEPPQLACLSRYYGTRSERRPSGYVVTLPDGTELPFDDGRQKTAEARIEHPDLEDMFAVRYRTGPIAPVADPDDDPGRARVDALFQARYGKGESGVRPVRIRLFGQLLRVHRLVAPAFRRVEARLEPELRRHPELGEYLTGLGGTLVFRNIAGTERPSAHSYGISLDINVRRSHYWRWQKPAEPLRWRNRIPQVIVDAFEAEGFIWGGRWYHYDTMHFEYRPELLDPQCYGVSPPAQNR